MVYEFKQYTPHAGKAEALKARFAVHTVPIFQRLGFELVAAFTPQAPRDEELWYLLAFADEDARQAAWAAFAADTQWLRVKAETERDGPLLARQSTQLLHPLALPAHAQAAPVWPAGLI